MPGILLYLSTYHLVLTSFHLLQARAVREALGRPGVPRQALEELPAAPNVPLGADRSQQASLAGEPAQDVENGAAPEASGGAQEGPAPAPRVSLGRRVHLNLPHSSAFGLWTFL